LGLVRPGELRPLAAIEIAERWARRQPDVTLDMVRMAADAAYASYAAYGGDAGDGDAAAYASYAAYAVAAAAYAVAAAAAAAADDADADARIKALKQCADIVREFFPEPPVLV